MAPKKTRKILLSKPLKNFQNFFHPWKGSNFHLNSFKLLLSPSRHRSCCCRRRCCRRRCRRRHCCHSQKSVKIWSKIYRKTLAGLAKEWEKKSFNAFFVIKMETKLQKQGKANIKTCWVIRQIHKMLFLSLMLWIGFIFMIKTIALLWPPCPPKLDRYHCQTKYRQGRSPRTSWSSGTESC